MHIVMTEEELRDSFKKLTIEANKVLEANDDVAARYIAENAAELDKGMLSKQQKANLD